MPDWICPTEVTDVHSGYRTAGRPDHVGVDLGALWGQPIVAPRAGVVVFVHDADDNAAGRHINLNHDAVGVHTRYFHMAEIWVERGQWVEQGQTIGLVGTTGGVPQHLHYEMRGLPGLAPFDPTPYLVPWFAPGIPLGGVLSAGEAPAPPAPIEEENDVAMHPAVVTEDGHTVIAIVGLPDEADPSHNVYGAVRNPDGTWILNPDGNPWVNLEGIATAPLELAVVGNRATVYARGTDNALWSLDWTPEAGWGAKVWDSHAGTIPAPPKVYV